MVFLPALRFTESLMPVFSTLSQAFERTMQFRQTRLRFLALYHHRLAIRLDASERLRYTVQVIFHGHSDCPYELPCQNRLSTFTSLSAADLKRETMSKVNVELKGKEAVAYK